MFAVRRVLFGAAAAAVAVSQFRASPVATCSPPPKVPAPATPSASSFASHFSLRSQFAVGKKVFAAWVLSPGARVAETMGRGAMPAMPAMRILLCYLLCLT